VKPLGKILVYGIPLWIIKLVLPIGFGWLHCADMARIRTVAGPSVTLAVAGLVSGIAIWAPGSPDKWLVPALLALGSPPCWARQFYSPWWGGFDSVWAHDLPIESVP